jgi:hypothetical protein
MNKFYHLFDYKYNKQKLLDVFRYHEQHNLLHVEKGLYRCVDTASLMSEKQPLFEELGMQQNPSDMMLCSIDRATGLHCNPGNNGLAILPLEGELNFDFYNFKPPLVEGRTSFMPSDTTQAVLDTYHTLMRGLDRPLVFNGRLIHDYWPATRVIFYAVKVPLGHSWEKTITLLSL